jgi:hypothetical protein
MIDNLSQSNPGRLLPPGRYVTQPFCADEQNGARERRRRLEGARAQRVDVPRRPSSPAPVDGHLSFVAVHEGQEWW